MADSARRNRTSWPARLLLPILAMFIVVPSSFEVSSAAELLYGPGTALQDVDATILGTKDPGNNPDLSQVESVGYKVAFVGDLDGDGFDDLALAAEGHGGGSSGPIFHVPTNVSSPK